ncbi:phage tail assembly chaperone [Pseudomonas sp. OV546]|uniref:phage tail assembly chaperone n=1 Tax=Pseudomonas sp. OV546 TaxID=1881063 RepID=UPI0008EA4834|nr:phage tail assembly chaperone [Pseudomonas sp. OV546]SFU55571.1 Phage tail assembly chaperone protein [Pseudomonas sp. OV546]
MRKFLALNDNREVIAHLIEGVHEIPLGAALMDGELWYEVTQDIGCTWHVSDAGVLSKRSKVDFLKDPATFEREWRGAELAAVIWLRERHRDEQELGGETTLSAEQFAELLAYMQSLRNWPQSPDFPDSRHRPIAPPWIAEQSE